MILFTEDFLVSATFLITIPCPCLLLFLLTSNDLEVLVWEEIYKYFDLTELKQAITCQT